MCRRKLRDLADRLTADAGADRGDPQQAHEGAVAATAERLGLVDR